MFEFLYQKVLKPILFLFPADSVHAFFLFFGRILGKYNATRWFVKKSFFYKHRLLQQTVAGISFENPIGLAAGFDYNADLIGIMSSVGFGFNTVGTVTCGAYDGNPKPMLGRLPKSQSLLVNKGFKNEGIKKVLEKIVHQHKTIPLGLSIGSTNKPFETTHDLIEDIAYSFEYTCSSPVFSSIDYFELNISCPNLINTEHLKEKPDTPEGLRLLLDRLSNIHISRPVYIKMHVEKSVEDSMELARIASEYKIITGLIFSNLVKDRKNQAFDSQEIASAGRGGFSGKPVEQGTNILLSSVYKKYKDRFVLIGCGGVFTGEDAFEKIRRGASLIQLITGMIYKGPQQIGQMNRELVSLLSKNGFKNLEEARGTHPDSL